MAACVKHLGSLNENVGTPRENEVLHQDDGVSLISEISESPSGEILRFIPHNEAAQLAFHELAIKMQDDHLDQHHAQYIVIRGKGFVADREGYDQGLSEEGTSAESQNENPAEAKEVYMGYFAVNFKHPTVAKGGKWAIGRGITKGGPDRNVDVLLAAPDSSHRKRLAPAHAFLQMNLASGAWMINAGNICRHTASDSNGNECVHTPVLLDERRIKHGDFSCISRARARFVVGGLHYLIHFSVKDVNLEKPYLVDRGVWLIKNGLEGPDPLMSSIPFDSDIRTDHAIFRRGLGSGSFGTVFEGFDPISGDARAVKKMTIKSDAKVPEIQSEVEAHAAFAKHIGIVKFYGYSNSLGQVNFGPSYPLEIYMTMAKGRSFQDTFAVESLVIDQFRQKKLCKQLLNGLAAIHEKGWMHRDINPMNILYFANAPEHAGLCDFGKLCRGKTSNATAIAAWFWLPPEIQENQKKTYDQKIDVWLLGYALVFSWYRDRIEGKLRNFYHHDKTIKSLSKKKDPFLLLLVKMLSWKPENRPSAQQALDDLSLQDISLQKEDESGDSSRKRAHPENI